MYSAPQQALTSHWIVASLQESKIDEVDMGEYHSHGRPETICVRAATDLGSSTLRTQWMVRLNDRFIVQPCGTLTTGIDFLNNLQRVFQEQ